MLQYNYTVSIHRGSKLSRIVSIDRAFLPICYFSFLFLRRFPLRGVVFLFSINICLPKTYREKNISARSCGRTQKIHRQEAYCPLSIFYIYDMRSAVIMSQFTPAPRRLTRPARALGYRHLIRLAAVRNESWDETPPYCA